MELEGSLSAIMLAVVLMLVMLAAWDMDAVGIHAVFLLPMFFTYLGLNTRLDMVNSAQLFFIALAVLAASVVAKGGACWAAARLWFSWRL